MELATQAVIKHTEADFQVIESYVIDFNLPPAEDHHLVMLKKCGFSTFEAINKVALVLGIESKKITYHGLKDEDAITQQLLNITMPKTMLLANIEKINAEYIDCKHYIHLNYLQHSPYPLKIGGLVSNNFLLTIRKLPPRVSKAFNLGDVINLLFLNYYGPQRFSLPNQEPCSHLIGKAICANDFTTAHTLICKQISHLGDKARQFDGDPVDFFNKIDCREKNFFINAYYSDKWNDELKSLLIQSNLNLFMYVDKSIPYFFADTKDLRHSPVPDFILQSKVRGDDPHSHLLRVGRHALLQVIFKVVAIEEDDCFQGYYKTRLQFSLPSGSYATMAIAQLLYQIEAQHG